MNLEESTRRETEGGGHGLEGGASWQAGQFVLASMRSAAPLKVLK